MSINFEYISMFTHSMFLLSCFRVFFVLRFFRGELMEEWGQVNLRLDEFLKSHNISRSSVSRNAQIHYGQLLKYCRNDMQKVDLNLLARICKTIDCEIGDIIEYLPPNHKQ